MKNKLHPASILKHSYKLSLANIIGYGLQIPVSLYVSSRLGPENYGLVAFVMLWAFYGRLIRPGLISSAGREMPHYIGREQISAAISIQNICLTYEFIFYLFVSGIMLVASFFFKNKVIRIGLILTAISLVLDFMDSAYTNAQWVFQRFNIITSINFLKAVITPLLTFVLVYFLSVYGLLVLPIAISIISILYFIFSSPKLNFIISFDSKKLMPLLKVGVILQFLTFLFWAFRGIDRTIVAMYFSKEQLGYYAFAIAFIANIYKIISDFGNVLSPILISELGRTGDYLLVQKEFQQLIVILTVAGCAIANLAQAGFGAMIFWFSPKFMPCIKIFEIFSFTIIFTIILLVPFNLLLSPLINKQKICNYIYGAVLVSCIALARPLIKMAGGIMGIVYLFAGAQAAITLAVLFAAKKYLFKDKNGYILFSLWAAALLSIAIVNYFVFSLRVFSYSNGHIFIPLVNRIILILSCWGTVGYIMFRLFTKDKNLVRLVKEKIAQGARSNLLP